MADVKWIKIATDIFDDEKILLIESLPDHYAIITVWFKLLCLAGKQNNSGVFMISNKIPYTDEMFATIFRMPINTVRLALETFSNFGMVEIVNNVVTIPNWDRHQKLDAYEKKKAYDRKYQAEKKAKQKEIVDKSYEQSYEQQSDIGIADKNRIEEKRIEENIYSSLSAEVKEAFDHFLNMRKKLKKPMSDLAIKRLINKLENLSSDPAMQVKILNQSEDHCWLDVYPLKDSIDRRPVKQNGESTKRPDDYYSNMEKFYE